MDDAEECDIYGELDGEFQTDPDPKHQFNRSKPTVPTQLRPISIGSIVAKLSSYSNLQQLLRKQEQEEGGEDESETIHEGDPLHSEEEGEPKLADDLRMKSDKSTPQAGQPVFEDGLMDEVYSLRSEMETSLTREVASLKLELKQVEKERDRVVEKCGSLERNIAILLTTAKKELAAKDKMIMTLRRQLIEPYNQTFRSPCPLSYRNQPQERNETVQNQSNDKPAVDRVLPAHSECRLRPDEPRSDSGGRETGSSRTKEAENNVKKNDKEREAESRTRGTNRIRGTDRTRVTNRTREGSSRHRTARHGDGRGSPRHDRSGERPDSRHRYMTPQRSSRAPSVVPSSKVDKAKQLLDRARDHHGSSYRRREEKRERSVLMSPLKKREHSVLMSPLKRQEHREKSLRHHRTSDKPDHEAKSSHEADQVTGDLEDHSLNDLEELKRRLASQLGDLNGDLQLEITLEPELPAETKLITGPEVTMESAVTSQPEWTMEPEINLEPDETTEPEVTMEPKVTSQPELTIEPEINPKPEVTTEPEALESSSGIDNHSQIDNITSSLKAHPDLTIKDAPTPIEDTPTPIEDTPTPIETTPTPFEDTPTPFEDTPTPIEDTPTPIEDTPTPIVDTPTLRDEAHSCWSSYRVVANPDIVSRNLTIESEIEHVSTNNHHNVELKPKTKHKSQRYSDKSMTVFEPHTDLSIPNSKDASGNLNQIEGPSVENVREIPGTYETETVVIENGGGVHQGECTKDDVSKSPTDDSSELVATTCELVVDSAILSSSLGRLEVVAVAKPTLEIVADVALETAKCLTLKVFDCLTESNNLPASSQLSIECNVEIKELRPNPSSKNQTVRRLSEDAATITAQTKKLLSPESIANLKKALSQSLIPLKKLPLTESQPISKLVLNPTVHKPATDSSRSPNTSSAESSKSAKLPIPTKSTSLQPKSVDKQTELLLSPSRTEGAASGSNVDLLVATVDPKPFLSSFRIPKRRQSSYEPEPSTPSPNSGPKPLQQPKAKPYNPYDKKPGGIRRKRDTAAGERLPNHDLQPPAPPSMPNGTNRVPLHCIQPPDLPSNPDETNRLPYYDLQPSALPSITQHSILSSLLSAPRETTTELLAGTIDAFKLDSVAIEPNIAEDKSTNSLGLLLGMIHQVSDLSSKTGENKLTEEPVKPNRLTVNELHSSSHLGKDLPKDKAGNGNPLNFLLDVIKDVSESSNITTDPRNRVSANLPSPEKTGETTSSSISTQLAEVDVLKVLSTLSDDSDDSETQSIVLASDTSTTGINNPSLINNECEEEIYIKEDVEEPVVARGKSSEDGERFKAVELPEEHLSSDPFETRTVPKEDAKHIANKKITEETYVEDVPVVLVDNFGKPAEILEPCNSECLPTTVGSQGPLLEKDIVSAESTKECPGSSLEFDLFVSDESDISAVSSKLDGNSFRNAEPSLEVDEKDVLVEPAKFPLDPTEKSYTISSFEDEDFSDRDSSDDDGSEPATIPPLIHSDGFSSKFSDAAALGRSAALLFCQKLDGENPSEEKVTSQSNAVSSNHIKTIGLSNDISRWEESDVSCTDTDSNTSGRTESGTEQECRSHSPCPEGLPERLCLPPNVIVEASEVPLVDDEFTKRKQKSTDNLGYKIDLEDSPMEVKRDSEHCHGNDPRLEHHSEVRNRSFQDIHPTPPKNRRHSSADDNRGSILGNRRSSERRKEMSNEKNISRLEEPRKQTDGQKYHLRAEDKNLEREIDRFKFSYQSRGDIKDRQFSADLADQYYAGQSKMDTEGRPRSKVQQRYDSKWKSSRSSTEHRNDRDSVGSFGEDRTTPGREQGVDESDSNEEKQFWRSRSKEKDHNRGSTSISVDGTGRNHNYRDTIEESRTQSRNRDDLCFREKKSSRERLSERQVELNHQKSVDPSDKTRRSSRDDKRLLIIRIKNDEVKSLNEEPDKTSRKRHDSLGSDGSARGSYAGKLETGHNGQVFMRSANITRREKIHEIHLNQHNEHNKLDDTILKKNHDKYRSREHKRLEDNWSRHDRETVSERSSGKEQYYHDDVMSRTRTSSLERNHDRTIPKLTKQDSKRKTDGRFDASDSCSQSSSRIQVKDREYTERRSIPKSQSQYGTERLSAERHNYQPKEKREASREVSECVQEARGNKSDDREPSYEKHRKRGPDNSSRSKPVVDVDRHKRRDEILPKTDKRRNELTDRPRIDKMESPDYKVAKYHEDNAEQVTRRNDKYRLDAGWEVRESKRRYPISPGRHGSTRRQCFDKSGEDMYRSLEYISEHRTLPLLQDGRDSRDTDSRGETWQRLHGREQYYHDDGMSRTRKSSQERNPYRSVVKCMEQDSKRHTDGRFDASDSCSLSSSRTQVKDQEYTERRSIPKSQSKYETGRPSAERHNYQPKEKREAGREVSEGVQEARGHKSDNREPSYEKHRKRGLDNSLQLKPVVDADRHKQRDDIHPDTDNRRNELIDRPRIDKLESCDHKVAKYCEDDSEQVICRKDIHRLNAGRKVRESKRRHSASPKSPECTSRRSFDKGGEDRYRSSECISEHRTRPLSHDGRAAQDRNSREKTHRSSRDTESHRKPCRSSRDTDCREKTCRSTQDTDSSRSAKAAPSSRGPRVGKAGSTERFRPDCERRNENRSDSSERRSHSQTSLNIERQISRTNHQRSLSPPSLRPRSMSPRSPRQRSPRQRSPRQRSPRQRSPRQRSPMKRSLSPRSMSQRSPRQRSPKQRSPRQRSPRQRSPRQRSPRQRSPRQRSPRQRSRSKEREISKKRKRDRSSPTALHSSLKTDLYNMPAADSDYDLVCVGVMTPPPSSPAAMITKVTPDEDVTLPATKIYSEPLTGDTQQPRVSGSIPAGRKPIHLDPEANREVEEGEILSDDASQGEKTPNKNKLDELEKTSKKRKDVKEPNYSSSNKKPSSSRDTSSSRPAKRVRR